MSLLYKLFGKKNYFKNIFATLEDGYAPGWLAKGIINFQNGVNGQQQKFKEPTTKTPDYNKREFDNNLQQLKTNLKPHWQLI